MLVRIKYYLKQPSIFEIELSNFELLFINFLPQHILQLINSFLSNC
jgi:hypothetical protein